MRDLTDNPKEAKFYAHIGDDKKQYFKEMPSCYYGVGSQCPEDKGQAFYTYFGNGTTLTPIYNMKTDKPVIDISKAGQDENN